MRGAAGGQALNSLVGAPAEGDRWGEEQSRVGVEVPRRGVSQWWQVGQVASDGRVPDTRRAARGAKTLAGSICPGPLLSARTLPQLPLYHMAQGRRWQRRAGWGRPAGAQSSSRPELQRTGLQTAPRPQVVEHCGARGSGTGCPSGWVGHRVPRPVSVPASQLCHGPSPQPPTQETEEKSQTSAATVPAPGTQGRPPSCLDEALPPRATGGDVSLPSHSQGWPSPGPASSQAAQIPGP